MNVFFDTSVLVPAIVDQLSNHPASFAVFHQYTNKPHDGYCSTHALAECYSVLTSLPLPKRISPMEAQILIEESILNRLKVIELFRTDYLDALQNVSKKGLSGGILYDALHLTAALKEHCTRVYTYNVDHFRSLAPDIITITTP